MRPSKVCPAQAIVIFVWLREFKKYATAFGLALAISACAMAPTPATPTATPTATRQILQPDPTPTPAPATLTLWLPPQFAPGPDDPAAQTLARQLANFEQTHNVRVTVRVKAETGPGGLLDSLLGAFTVAPQALPDVVALPADDLARAARAGVLVPLDLLLPAETLTDTYPFAQTLSRVEGRWVGAPFAADARVLVYDTSLYDAAPLRWADVVTGTLIFPGGESDGLTLLSDYLALGGSLTDDAGQPALDAARLAQVFAQLRALQEAERLSAAVLTYDDPTETWQVFRERRAGLALTTARWYLREADRMRRSAAALPPTAEGAPFTLAEGWSWAIVNRDAGRELSALLVQALIAPDALAEWTRAARWLPPRPSALAAWGDDPFAPLAAEALTRAQLRPPAEILTTFGPPLRSALSDVLSGRATPETAAQQVAGAR
ncbi:MAG: extracellular solute-binding protein [Anaerolineales bacterium]|nr:extracellular solute-binding protein [Anaerolineales bacterium]